MSCVVLGCVALSFFLSESLSIHEQCVCIDIQLNPVEASIIQPSPEELRKKQLASELFGMGGGGLSGPARAPRHKPRKGNLGKIDPTPQQRAGGQSEVKTVETTDLLLDLQVSKRNLYIMYMDMDMCTPHFS